MLRTSLRVESLEDRTVPANLPNGFTESLIAAGLDLPTSMTVAPDGRIFITEKTGGIRVVKSGQLLPTPFATVTTDTGFERGLQSLAFDPQFEQNGYVYVYYTLPVSNGETRNRVARFTANGDVAAGGPTALITLDPVGGAAHNGGALAFGPDGKLYVSTGDGSVPTNSQSITNRLGKILRYNPDGSIPGDNPTSFPRIAGTTTGENRAIWAIGLRNPFTMAFQPGTGRFYINDVGGSKFEEINVGQRGANYGWPIAEGPPGASGALSGVTYPIYSYANLGRAAIAGAAFYNPVVSNFPSQYVGDYFFADYVNGVVSVRDAGTGNVTQFATGANGLVNLTVLQDGRLAYLKITDSQGNPNSGSLTAINFGSGTIPPGIAFPPQDLLVSDDESATFSPLYSGSAPLTFQWQRDSGSGFANIPGATGPSYTLFDAQLPDDGSRFRVIVTNPYGSVTSLPATLSVTDSERPTVSIVSPDPGFLFRGGQPVFFSFVGNDPETGVLPPESFTYKIDYITGTANPRPFISLTVGNSGSFTPATITPYLRTDVAYRITVTVRDDVGLDATIIQDVYPLVTSFTVASNFPRVELFVDGSPVFTDHVELSVVGLQREIEAPELVVTPDRTYRFIGWSDGGPRVRFITVADTPQTFTAIYELVSGSLGAVTPGVVVGAAGRLGRVKGGVEDLVVEPFGSGFTGEIRVASGDLNGDGVSDLVAAAGPGGGPHIKVFDGVTGEEIRSFFAYDPSFTGGLFVAVGDVDGDGTKDLIIAAGPGGGPHVKVIRISDMTEILSFFAYDPSYTGGARVATGDINGDGASDIITSAGTAGGPHVRVIDGKTLEELMSFFAYDESFTGGVWITSADLNQDGVWEIITGAGPGAGPHVKAFDSKGEEAASFLAFEESFAGGVRVGAGDDNVDGYPDIVAGAGPGGAPHVSVFNGRTFELIDSFIFGLDTDRNGAYVG